MQCANDYTTFAELQCSNTVICTAPELPAGWSATWRTQRSPDPLADLGVEPPGKRRMEGGGKEEEREKEGKESRNAPIQSWQA